jgi:hypothetical protein
MNATATKVIPSGGSGRPGGVGQSSNQLIVAEIVIYISVQMGGGSLSMATDREIG